MVGSTAVILLQLIRFLWLCINYEFCLWRPSNSFFSVWLCKGKNCWEEFKFFDDARLCIKCENDGLDYFNGIILELDLFWGYSLFLPQGSLERQENSELELYCFLVVQELFLVSLKGEMVHVSFSSLPFQISSHGNTRTTNKNRLPNYKWLNLQAQKVTVSRQFVALDALT